MVKKLRSLVSGIAALAAVFSLGAVQIKAEDKTTSSNVCTASGQKDCWYKSSDNTWTYSFSVVTDDKTDKVPDYYYWESDLSGYTSDHPMANPGITENGAGVVTNTSNSLDVGSLRIEKVTTTDAKFTFDVSLTAADGSALSGNAIYGGTVFVNGKATVKVGRDSPLTITGILYDGPTQATGVTYEYYNYSTTASPAGYVKITSTSNTSPIYTTTENGRKVLKVKGSAVNGYSSFKITATYKTHTYEDYISLIDKTDPLQVSVHSTIGTQIKNAQGVGCLYVRVTRDGTEIDPVPPNIVASITEPSGSNGDYYIKLTKPTQSNPTGSAQLMKHNGSTWVAQTSRCSYAWTYRNVNNVPLGNSDTKPATSGQFIYIDGTLIQNKITADVQVTLDESSS